MSHSCSSCGCESNSEESEQSYGLTRLISICLAVLSLFSLSFYQTSKEVNLQLLKFFLREVNYSNLGRPRFFAFQVNCRSNKLNEDLGRQFSTVE